MGSECGRGGQTARDEVVGAESVIEEHQQRLSDGGGEPNELRAGRPL